MAEEPTREEREAQYLKRLVLSARKICLVGPQLHPDCYCPWCELERSLGPYAYIEDDDHG